MWFNLFPQTQAVHTSVLFYITHLKPLKFTPVDGRKMGWKKQNLKTFDVSKKP
jgi:hypothetical protein